MQINFEPKKIKEAHAYVDRLHPIKRSKIKKIFKKDREKKLVIKEDSNINKESSLITKILNFLFK